MPDDYLQPYREAQQEHGDAFSVTLWARPETQQKRFAVFTEMIDFAGKRVLDAGCSRGDFAQYLLDHGHAYGKFTGVDGVPEVIDFANRRGLPNACFVAGDFAQNRGLLAEGQPQITAISGTLNTMDATTATAVLESAWAGCSEALVFNFLSDRCDPSAPPQEAPAVRLPTEQLLAWAFESKRRALSKGQTPNALFEKVVFSKLRAKLGGRVRYMSTGSAPISAEVMEFLRIAFGCVLEGYGMTESACVISKTAQDDFTTGHVGAPAPCCEIKLVDVPEMRYTKNDHPHPRGEICVRGPSVFRGYYKNDAETADVVDRDGWLHTGDIGTWLPGGRLKIIDRKKNIFKLAQGEYVAPEKIENVYARNKFVAQSFVYGDSLQAHLVAVVVPDEEVLMPWAAAKSSEFKGMSFKDLCADERVKAHVLKSMIATGNDAGLKGFEQVRAIRLCDELFAVENGLITPTFKLKRPQARERFQRDIDEMYARGR